MQFCAKYYSFMRKFYDYTVMQQDFLSPFSVNPTKRDNSPKGELS